MKNKKIPRRKFLKKVGTGVAAASAIPLLGSKIVFDKDELEKVISSKDKSELKNIIFILSDDHRFDFMGFMNKIDFIETPNMDKMAREGAHFENAFVSTSLCSPSRASILTGMYAHNHRVVDNATVESKELIYFPQYLQKIGYETAFIGKWHMGISDDNPRKGFDRWVSFKGQGEYFNPHLNVDGKRIRKEGYITDILTDYAIEWLGRKRSKPFFLYLSHKAIHAMFEPPKRDKGKFDKEKVPHPASMADTAENYKGKPLWVKAQRYSWHGVDNMYYNSIDFDTYVKRYCETLISLDQSVGKIIDFVNDNHIAEKTITFYMGDNGLMFGEHGLIDKRQMYEESMRVPLLAYAPGFIKPGTKIKQMVQNIDIAPTILDIAGIKTPKQMDGISFLPLLKKNDCDWRKKIYYEYFWERAFPMTPTVFGIRTDKFKYMYYWGIWDTEELYDLENDPEEMNNLIHSEEHKEIVKELSSDLFKWIKENHGINIPVRKPGDFIRDGMGADVIIKKSNKKLIG